MEETRPSTSLRSAQWRPIVATVVLLGMLPAAGSGAQEPSTSDPRGPLATRAELEVQAAAAERRASNPAYSAEGREFHRGEAWLIRRRLDEGDFAAGDRIVLDVVGEPTLTDTFTVRPGLVLQLADLPAISVHGVLRSELRSRITTALQQFMRDPQVRAVPLLRVAVLGEVLRPGFYHVRADMLLSEVLMLAGGPSTNIDLKRSEIRRGAADLHSASDVHIALTDGISLDALSLRSGDEFFLEARRQRNWLSILQAVSVASGLITLFVSLAN